MTQVVFLNVSFDNKEEAKGLGAAWNAEYKKWFCEKSNLECISKFGFFANDSKSIHSSANGFVEALCTEQNISIREFKNIYCVNEGKFELLCCQRSSFDNSIKYLLEKGAISLVESPCEFEYTIVEFRVALKTLFEDVKIANLDSETKFKINEIGKERTMKSFISILDLLNIDKNKADKYLVTLK
jgi:hypothetical protein